MKKFNNAKWFFLGVVFTLIVSMLIIPGIAANSARTATLNYRNIDIRLNGGSITPKDVNGNIVEPFIIDGTTYLPVRAVADAMGLYVNWYAEENRVVLRTDEYLYEYPIPDDGGIQIDAATLTSAYGTPRLYVELTNLANVSIDRVDFVIECYGDDDLFGVFEGHTYTPIGAHEETSLHWELTGFEETNYVEFAIVKVTTSDGDVIQFSDAELSWFYTYE